MATLNWATPEETGVPHVAAEGKGGVGREPVELPDAVEKALNESIDSGNVVTTAPDTLTARSFVSAVTKYANSLKAGTHFEFYGDQGERLTRKAIALDGEYSGPVRMHYSLTADKIVRIKKPKVATPEPVADTVPEDYFQA